MLHRHRFLRRLLLGTLALVCGGLLLGWFILHGSLPMLTGRLRVPGLAAAVQIARDANGVPTIQAANQEDAARALGFLHGQERFFQMDLMRRQAAGELAELFGPAAVELDQQMRLHQFRHRAAGMLARFDAEELRLLDAYTAGVNAGLAALQTRPWEYFVLRAPPRSWTREDSLFVVESMTAALQEHAGLDERIRLAIRETYGTDVLAFLQPSVTPDSAALDGSSAPLPPVPEADFLRVLKAAASRPKINQALNHPAARWPLPDREPDEVPGSNSFALAGQRAQGGGALVANDMHLNLAVPNTWYRVSLQWPGRAVTGVTLPGVPGVVVGSNGDVAWGFTDAYVDTSDVILIERDPARPDRYRVPDGGGWEPFATARETIRVAGHAPQAMEIVSTRWGPLLTPVSGTAGKVLALRWAAHDPDAINLRLTRLMDAHNVAEAVEIAHRCGLPAQNFLVGDRNGAIAWTIIGRVPRRVGFDGSLPESWADGSHRWEGFLPPEEIPTIDHPAGEQLWTANNRVVGGEALAKLGNGGYDLAARAAQIRDDLAAMTGRKAAPRDGLAVQLDDTSRFLERWRGLLLSTLTDDLVRSEPALKLGELRSVVRTWNGHTDVNQAGHRLVREFRQNVTVAVMDPIYEPVRRQAPELNLSHTRFKGAEEPLWALLSARPKDLLPGMEPSPAGWNSLLAKSALATARNAHTTRWRDYTWGQVNTLQMQHPFARLLPGPLAALLDMPARPLPGDNNMPRVQGASFGASERMDVSPGREQEGIFHQPGGPSGHPLSPFYRAGHEDWAEGRPSPFLPGPTRYTLLLQP